jgi:hypothetical protein
MDGVTKENLQQTIKNIRSSSPILKQMEDAEYHMGTGTVEFL